MSCKLWIQKSLPLIEGSLPAPEARAYRDHLAGCPVCAAEVAASQRLVHTLQALPDPDLTPAQASALERAILDRVRRPAMASAPAATAAARSRARAAAWAPSTTPMDPARAAAARSIATRSRLAGRPLFAGERPTLEPSFLLMAFGITIASMATTVFFGEWMVRAIGARLVGAVSALGGSGAWLSLRVSEAMVAMTAILRIARGVIENVTPWFDAVRDLAAQRGPELLMAAAAIAVLLGIGAIVLRRDGDREFEREKRGVR